LQTLKQLWISTVGTFPRLKLKC